MTDKRKPKKKHFIACQGCGGSGTVPLPAHLEDVLAVIARHEEIDTPSIVKEEGSNVNCKAMSNRLTRLFQLKFVARRRQGKFWIWRKI